MVSIPFFEKHFIIVIICTLFSQLQPDPGKDLEFSSISVSMNVDQHGRPVNSSDAFELLRRTGDDSSTEINDVLASDSLRFRVMLRLL